MKIYFAPLQGYTDAAYRRVHYEVYGSCIDCYYSPFIRIEKGEIRARDLRDVHPQNNVGINLVPQIIVSSVSEFNYLVDRIADMGYSRIDINMGCPFPLQTRKGRGAGILPHSDVVSRILEVVRLRDTVKFSIKMRLGLDSANECMSLIPSINDTPLQHVVVHPRTGKQQYKGSLDIETFNLLYQTIQHPIIYNGDILDIEDINKVECNYPQIHGVMVGRGLLARPSLASEYQKKENMSKEHRIELLLKMHGLLFDHYVAVLQGENQLLQKIKAFWDYLEPEIGHKICKLIRKSTSISKYKLALSNIEYND